MKILLQDKVTIVTMPRKIKVSTLGTNRGFIVADMPEVYGQYESLNRAREVFNEITTAYIQKKHLYIMPEE